MFYSCPCSYCNKVFYTYNDNREKAAETLFNGIKQHLIEYDEDRKEYEFDDEPKIEVNEVYTKMIESKDPTPGGYEL